MEHYAGTDVSLECSSVCAVDASGKVVREAKVVSEPEALIGWFGSLGFELARIGLEAGPLAQLVYSAMKQAGPSGGLLEARHVRDWKSTRLNSSHAHNSYVHFFLYNK